MASVHRKPGKSPYWFASYTLPNGKRTLRSTKQIDKAKALDVARELEKASQKARGGHMSEKHARDLIAQLYEIGNGQDLPESTVRDHIHLWLKDKSTYVADSSFVEYERVCGSWLKFLGKKADHPVESITKRDVTTYKAGLMDRVSVRTAQKYMKIMRMVWRDAERQSLINDNPFQKIALPGGAGGKNKNKSPRRKFENSELNTLLAYVSGEWKGLVLFGLYTGQRLGDIALLTWDNIKSERGIIEMTIRKTGRELPIPIHKRLVDYLADLPVTDDPKSPIFPKAHESVQRIGSVNTLSRQFSEILKKSGIVSGSERHTSQGKGRNTKRKKSRLSFHSLRHSAVTLLKEAGVSNAVVMELIGHESEAISRAYTHMGEAALRAAVNKLPDITANTENA